MGNQARAQQSSLLFGGTRRARHLWVCVITLCGWLTIVGCGGQVAVPGPEETQDVDEDGGAGGEAGGPFSFHGRCVKCDGQKECGFCLIQAFESTFICPTGQSKPSAACMDLLESHTTLGGESFTCFYCD